MNDPLDRDQSLVLLRSDLEQATWTHQERESMATSILEQINQFLDHANQTVEDIIDNDGMLGDAIIRTTQTVADAIGNLASQLENQTQEERTELAQAYLQDMQQHSLLLQVEDEHTHEEMAKENESQSAIMEYNRPMTELSEREVSNAIQGAATLMRDVEATLRAIDRNEAEEIADVALTVAQIFLASLQSFISTITPEDLLLHSQQQHVSSSSSSTTTTAIEILDQNFTSQLSSPIENQSIDEKNHQSKQMKSNNNNNNKKKKKRSDRIKVIWPPLGPAVASTFHWGKDAAMKQPLLAVALGMTLWPAAAVTTLIGCPIVLMDGLVQNMYKNLEETPVIVGIERSAAQLYHTTRLLFISGKLIGRQSLRILSKQVERHGGVGNIAQHVSGFAVERITHPVETIEMAWNTVAWGASSLSQFWDQWNDHERHPAVQDLQ